MQFTTILLSLVAVASAAEVRHYFFGNDCTAMGGYARFRNTPSGYCYPVEFGAPVRGSNHVALYDAEAGSQLFGFKRGPNMEWCGVVTGHKTVTVTNQMICLDAPPVTNWYPAWGAQYSAGRYFAPGDSAPGQGSVTCPDQATTEGCKGIVEPDQVVLMDGSVYELEGLNSAAKMDLVAFTANGSTAADIPEQYAHLLKV